MSFTLETAFDGQPRQFQFDAPSVAIGRDRGADFTLDHPTVSRQHAVVNWDGQAYRLSVISRGGLTAIDGQQVSGDVLLHDGSQLMFGQLAFVFRSPYAPPRPAGQAYGSPQQGVQQPVYAAPGVQPASTAGMHASASGIYQAPGQMPSPQPTMEFQAFAPTTTGQFPSMAEHEELAKKRTPQPDANGMMSWEEIAATADQVKEERDSLTDFRDMQKKIEQEDRENRGLNPLVIIGAILVAGVIALFFIYSPGGEGTTGTTETTGPPPEDDPNPILALRSSDTDCIGKAQCLDAARNAFKVGMVMVERQEADIVNLYEGYKQLILAEAFFERAKVEEIPSEMKNLTAVKATVEDTMKTRFIAYRNTYLSHFGYKDYEKMSETIDRVQAYFPDERLNYHRWAEREIGRMKANGVYPRR